MRKTPLLIVCIVTWFVHTQAVVELFVGGQTYALVYVPTVESSHIFLIRLYSLT